MKLQMRLERQYAVGDRVKVLFNARWRIGTVKQITGQGVLRVRLDSSRPDRPLGARIRVERQNVEQTVRLIEL